MLKKVLGAAWLLVISLLLACPLHFCSAGLMGSKETDTRNYDVIFFESYALKHKQEAEESPNQSKQIGYLLKENRRLLDLRWTEDRCNRLMEITDLAFLENDISTVSQNSADFLRLVPFFIFRARSIEKIRLDEAAIQSGTDRVTMKLALEGQRLWKTKQSLLESLLHTLWGCSKVDFLKDYSERMTRLTRLTRG